MFLNPHNTAFFSTCNDAYIPYSLTALLSIREFIPHAKLFIFSRNISTEHKLLLQKHNVKYFDLDLRGKFYRHWTYPVECYYLFAGPELLLKEGFKYSVYVDGDTLCLKNPLKNIGRIKGIGGAAIGNCRGVFLDDFETLKNLFNLNDEQINRYRITSSVVYFNNKRMSSIKLLDLAAEYFKKCLDARAPRKGDDSLFSIIQLVNLLPEEIKNLPSCKQFTQLSPRQNDNKGIAFLHFINQKPWNMNNIEGIGLPYLQKWHQIHRQHSEPIWEEKYQKELSIQKEADARSKEKRLESLSKQGLVLNKKQRERNHTKKPLEIFTSEDAEMGLTNFGDEVQKDIIPTIFGYRVIPYSDPKEATLFSVGSILFSLPHMDLSKEITVWGSGFISAEKVPNEETVIPKVQFSAVRGKYTLTRVKQYTDISSLPLGDPGILANIIYPENPTKTDKIGVVVHYIDADNPVVETLRKNDRFLIIDPLDSPREVAWQISSCQFIISSSLHGIIFADSYKIPNAHIHFSDKVYGGEYKFEDYDTGVDKTHLEFDPEKLDNPNYIKELKQAYKPIENLEKLQRNLIDAFPYK